MKYKLHIFGASGSGTTTLGKHLSLKYNIKNIDVDDIFWEITDPPYQIIVERNERIKQLESVLNNENDWILSGSLCGWGDFAIDKFNYAVFLYLPKDIRMKRLYERQQLRYGNQLKDNEMIKKQHTEFMEWANNYDSGDENMRSKKLHEKWISLLKCPIIRIEGDYSLDEKYEMINNEIKKVG